MKHMEMELQHCSTLELKVHNSKDQQLVLHNNRSIRLEKVHKSGRTQFLHCNSSIEQMEMVLPQDSSCRSLHCNSKEEQLVLQSIE